MYRIDCGRMVTMTTRRAAVIDNVHLINDNNESGWWLMYLTKRPER